jgi:hypothetical protein
MCKLHSSLQRASRVLGVLAAGVVPRCCSSLNVLRLVAYLSLSLPCIFFLVALGQRVDTRRSPTLRCPLGVDWEISHDRKTDTALFLPSLLGGFCLWTLLLAFLMLSLAEQSYLREPCDAVWVACLDGSLLSRSNCRRTVTAFSSP